jgi:putative transposase
MEIAHLQPVPTRGIAADLESARQFTEEQMVTILRKPDEKSVPEVAEKHGVSSQTIYGWRKHFGSLEPADINGLRQLEQETVASRRSSPTAISSSACRRESEARWPAGVSRGDREGRLRRLRRTPAGILRVSTGERSRLASRSLSR